ncbi:MAG: hypothetical protein PHF44_03250 [Candidatus Pacebacteria bacterium]|nr:hypothetical protein [Candidatus Paceibacterota bacterium]
MKDNLTKKVLLSLVIVGAFAIAATSPYFLMHIARAYFKEKKYNKRKVAKTLSALQKDGLVIGREKNGIFKITLTEKGKEVIKKYQFDDLKIEEQRVWDKKWRVAIFDIPEKTRKVAREALREKLKKLNFYLLQKSVLVYPYPCEKEIRFLAEAFEISPYVNVILAEKIFDDIKLKKYFELA